MLTRQILLTRQTLLTRSIIVLACAGLAGCANVSSPAVVTSASAALTDAQAILAALALRGGTPTPLAADATLVISALNGAVTGQAVAEITAGLRRVMADAPDAALQQTGNAAVASLASLATPGADTTEARAMIGAFLLDALARITGVQRLAATETAMVRQ